MARLSVNDLNTIRRRSEDVTTEMLADEVEELIIEKSKAKRKIDATNEILSEFIQNKTGQIDIIIVKRLLSSIREELNDYGK